MSLTKTVLALVLGLEDKRLSALENKMSTLETEVALVQTLTQTQQANTLKLQTDYAALITEVASLKATTGGAVDTTALDAALASLGETITGQVSAVETPTTTTPPTTTPTTTPISTPTTTPTVTIRVSPDVVPVGSTAFSLTVEGIGTSFTGAPFALAGPLGVGSSPAGAAIDSQTVNGPTSAVVTVNGPTAPDSAWSIVDSGSGAFAALSSV